MTTTAVMIEDWCDQDLEHEDVRMWGVYEIDDDGTETNSSTEKDFRDRRDAVDYANRLAKRLNVEVVE